MLDRDGYRPNVAIVIANPKNLVFWGKRVREHAWQFPQGGIQPGETPETAMYRELKEEVGLDAQHVKTAAPTAGRNRSGTCCACSATIATSRCGRPIIPSSTPGVGTTTGSRSMR